MAARRACERCPRAYVKRPLDTLIVAGEEMRLCGRCSGQLVGWLEWLFERRISAVKVEQLPFAQLAPDVIERDGSAAPF